MKIKVAKWGTPTKQNKKTVKQIISNKTPTFFSQVQLENVEMKNTQEFISDWIILQFCFLLRQLFGLHMV
jgi:hypothetical protein